MPPNNSSRRVLPVLYRTYRASRGRRLPVTWINQGDMPHNILSSEGKILKSSVLDTDQKFSCTFTKAGTYPYSCGDPFENDLQGLPSSTNAVRGYRLIASNTLRNPSSSSDTAGKYSPTRFLFQMAPLLRRSAGVVK